MNSPPKSQLANHELTTIALFLLGAEAQAVDLEDVAVNVNQMAPGRFAGRKCDGTTDYVLRSDISGAYLAPQGSDGVIWDGNTTAVIEKGEVISSSPSSLDPFCGGFTTIHSLEVAIGGQAILDGQYF